MCLHYWRDELRPLPTIMAILKSSNFFLYQHIHSSSKRKPQHIRRISSNNQNILIAHLEVFTGPQGFGFFPCPTFIVLPGICHWQVEHALQTCSAITLTLPLSMLVQHCLFLFFFSWILKTFNFEIIIDSQEVAKIVRKGYHVSSFSQWLHPI